ncbi:MAG: dihydroorotase [Phycisphaerales bacterium]|nr:MAG: dihydroorotase [Phycisphaerales bacterium]
MSMKTIVIRNGRVIDPSRKLDQECDVCLADGQIQEVGRVGRPAEVTIDAEGLIVAPGLLDIHVHLREPGQTELESIETGSAAAVAGGFTTVACMPNTEPPLDDEAAIEYVIRQGARAGLCNVLPVGAITKGRSGKELAEMGRMARAGAVGFSDDGEGVASPAVMRRALQYVAMFDRPIMQHCETPEIANEGVMHGGATAVRLGLPGLPAIAEELMLQRDITLTSEAGARYHAQHVSTAGSVELVRRARAKRLSVTAEVTPHHLLLTDACVATYDSNYKVKPPLRTAKDIAACIRGVKDGTITALASDHAPHSVAGKELEFQRAPFGIIGLETALAAYIRALILPGHIDWPHLIRLMTLGPAEVLGLTKGTLQVGRDADVTLIDPQRQWTVEASRFKSKARNCPWNGEDFVGKAVMTIVGGEVKYCEPEDDGRVGA